MRQRERGNLNLSTGRGVYHSTVLASYMRRRRVLCLNVTFPHRKCLARTYHSRVIVMECKVPYVCVWCTPTQRNLSTRARSQQTDLDGTMAPLGSAPATPPGARAESMTRR